MILNVPWSIWRETAFKVWHQNSCFCSATKFCRRVSKLAKPVFHFPSLYKESGYILPSRPSHQCSQPQQLSQSTPQGGQIGPLGASVLGWPLPRDFSLYCLDTKLSDSFSNFPVITWCCPVVGGGGVSALTCQGLDDLPGTQPLQMNQWEGGDWGF